jgi:hypothetical protein
MMLSYEKKQLLINLENTRPVGLKGFIGFGKYININGENVECLDFEGESILSLNYQYINGNHTCADFWRIVRKREDAKASSVYAECWLPE